MKRSIKNRISAFAAVLAVMLLFAACSKPAQIKRNDALANTAEAMMDKEYFTVTVTGTYSGEAVGRALDYVAVVKMQKTEDGYDYRAEITTTEEGKKTKRATVKVGDDMYVSTAGEDGEFTEWKLVPTEEQGENESMLSSLSGDTLKSVIGDVDSDEVLTEKNGKYEIVSVNDYGEMLNALKEFVVGGEGVQVGEYVAKSLNENYTREDLVNDINITFKDKITLLAMIRGINGFLSHIGYNTTVKEIVDNLCKKANITADDIYRIIEPKANEKLPSWLSISAPDKSDTPYEYIMSTGVGVVDVNKLFEMAGVNLTTEQIREALLSLFDNDDVMFDDLYDRVAEKFDPYLYGILAYLGADEEVLEMLKENGALLGTENLKNYTVGKTEVSRKTVVSSKDFSVLSFDLDVAADIAYGEEQKLLVKTEITAHAKFDYKAKVSITAPM